MYTNSFYIERVENIRFSAVYEDRKKIIISFLQFIPFCLFASFLIATLLYFESSGNSADSTARFFTASFFYLFLNVFLLFTLIWASGDLAYALKEDLKVRDKPNQGITSSAKNFAICFLSLYLFYMAIGLIVRYLFYGSITIETIRGIGLLMLMSSWIACFYVFGGRSVVQHITLRFLLHRQGHIPWNYARFLRYTTERRLTQQIGGSFRFLHRELLDHFADMYPSDAANAVAQREAQQ